MMTHALAGLLVGPALISGSVLKAVEPQVAATSDGRFAVVFGSGQTVYETHEADGGSWSSPKVVAQVPGMPLGMRRGPRLAIAGNTWVVTVPRLSRMKGDLLACASTDAGQTWKPPVRINDVQDCAPEGLQGLTALKDGRFMAVWLDGREGKTVLFGATSTPAAKAWGVNRALYRSPSGSICECCHPTVATSPEGEVVTMWRNSVGGFRDMFAGILVRDQLPTPAKLGEGTWKLDACPMDGGALALGPSGKRFATWRREGAVYVSGLSGGAEIKVGEGLQPWATAGTGQVWVAWLGGRRGPLMVRRMDTEPMKLAESADDPVLASTRSRVIAVWSDKDGVKAIEVR